MIRQLSLFEQPSKFKTLDEGAIVAAAIEDLRPVSPVVASERFGPFLRLDIEGGLRIFYDWSKEQPVTGEYVRLWYPPGNHDTTDEVNGR